jgi:TPR repeat protein
MGALGLAGALALMALAAPGEFGAGQPPISPEAQAAFAKARGGDASELVRLADAGHADAQFYLSPLLIFGAGGLPKDGARGCAYAEKAAATRGDAQHLVGECFEYGYGGVKDVDKAIAAFHRAGDMGMAKSRCAEGNMMFEAGRDEARAFALCREGAEAGDPDAQTDVGNYYLTGQHVAKDVAAARGWYEKAVAANGQRNAALVLGQIYWYGDGGVAKDNAKARHYWKIAYDGGRQDAAKLLGDEAFLRAFPDAAAHKLTPGQTRVDPAAMDEATGWYEKALAAATAEQRPDIEGRLKLLRELRAKVPAGATRP